MGDTGSLMLGGVIAVLAIILRKELLIPVLCGVFLIENLSVMLQVGFSNTEKENTGWNMLKTIDYSRCLHYITIIRKKVSTKAKS
jgi:UDP-N-acetylmuramyl pentapeptide phosphotransferase/UDP-N-acetylglucosamine-1-phosphate transferase